MSLTAYERHLISDIDRKIKRAEKCPRKTLFHDLINLAPTIKNILYSHEEKEIDLYVNAYEGFREFLGFLQNNMVAII
ncbi:MAG: hypothetical protein K2X39_09020 [Silvanigrellaceae bacterium]|nr:hypothetical protein [Silvanigrellaceae bacterium]